MLDLILASTHHILILALFGVLFVEVMNVRPGMAGSAIRRVAAIDAWYGVLAGLVLIVGFARAIFAAKGWDYYLHNVFFWAKIVMFVVIGLLSIPPTLNFLRWRRLAIAPSDAAISKVQFFLWMEVTLLVLLPVFAAAMARGYGLFSPY